MKKITSADIQKIYSEEALKFLQENRDVMMKRVQARLKEMGVTERTKEEKDEAKLS